MAQFSLFGSTVQRFKGFNRFKRFKGVEGGSRGFTRFS
jgi:hypothetical protein